MNTNPHVINQLAHNNDTPYGPIIAGVFVCILVLGCIISYTVGEHVGAKSVSEIDQRAAVLAGTGKWVANRETGSPEFAWTSCDALGVRR